MPAIDLVDLTLGYNGHPAVRYLDGRFDDGELIAIVGPNGSGKSTLLKGLAGLLKPLSGKIVRVGFANRDVAYLPQAGELDLSFPATVRELVELGLWPRRGLLKTHTLEDMRQVERALSIVGLAGFGHRQISSLSGGQLQRALFARLVLQDAKIILLDEPFTAIDESTTEDLMKLTLQWHEEGRTILAVLHDFAFVKRHFPKTLLLARRQVAWGSTNEVMTSTNLVSVQNLVETWDETALDYKVVAA